MRPFLPRQTWPASHYRRQSQQPLRDLTRETVERTALKCMWEREAERADLEAMALHLKAVALHQEIRASCIREEVRTITRQMARREEEVDRQEEEEAMGMHTQASYRRKGHRHRQ
jgi:hypothetical protein